MGSRIFYCDHGSFDSHAGQNPLHAKLWTDASEGLDAFMTDLRQHDAAENVIVLMFSEFSRRVRDNGSGTDHGAAGAAFVLGDRVKGGHYGEYPSLAAEHLVQGDLNPSMDFRGIYSTILDKWLKIDPVTIVNGTYEQPAFLHQAVGQPRSPGRGTRDVREQPSIWWRQKQSATGGSHGAYNGFERKNL
jgi:uncharacterized protein (DUF1501 family)